MMSNNTWTWNIPYAGGEMSLNRKDHREECDGMIPWNIHFIEEKEIIHST